MNDSFPPPPPFPPAATPGSAPKGPRRKLTLIVSIVVVVVLVVAGAVITLVLRANAAEDREREKEARVSAAEQADKEAAAAAEAAAFEHAQELHADCVDELGDLLDVLNETDALLDVGVNHDELSDLVGEMSVAYRTIDIDALGKDGCLSAGAAMERAFNAYNASQRRWGNCLYSLYCDTDLIDPELQRKWQKAGQQIVIAEGILESMDPESDDYDPDVAESDDGDDA